MFLAPLRKRVFQQNTAIADVQIPDRLGPQYLRHQTFRGSEDGYSEIYVAGILSTIFYRPN